MNFRQLFLPTPENNHTPHLLQRAALLMMFVMILLSFAVVNLQAILWQSSQWLVGTVLPAVVVDLTNDEREELQAVPLRRSSILDEAARLKAEHMSKNSYFAHYSPDGVSPWHWFNEVSYTYAHAGENLAIHFKDSGAVVNAWMESPSHRANIVNNNYTEIGVGTAKGIYEGYETVFVVQLFGTPALAPVVSVPIPTPPIITPEPILAVERDSVEEILVETALPNAEELVAGVEANEVSPIINEVVISPVDVTVATSASTVEEVVINPRELEVAEVFTEDKQTSIFSTHFATSSGLAPFIGTVSGTTAEQTTFAGMLATRPSVLLQSIYLVLGLFVAILLLTSIIIGIKHHRPLQVVYGIGLLMLMSGLFYVHGSLTTSVVVAAEPLGGLESLLNQ